MNTAVEPGETFKRHVIVTRNGVNLSTDIRNPVIETPV